MLPEKTCEWENCNQKFKRPEQLFQHVNQVHSQVGPSLTWVFHNLAKFLVDGQVTNVTFQARYCIFKLVNGVFICKWKACRRNREMNKSAPYKIKEHLRTHTG